MQLDLAFDAQVCAVATAFAQAHPTDADVAVFVALFTPIVERPVRNILASCPGCDVEQAVVDVFFRLWQKRAALPHNKTAVFYALRVAHSVAIDAYRKQKRSIVTVEMLPGDIEADGAPAHDTQNEPYRLVELQELLGILPQEVRAVFLAYYDEGCPAREIARRHRIRLPTVYARLRRAKILLRGHVATEQTAQADAGDTNIANAQTARAKQTAQVMQASQSAQTDDAPPRCKPNAGESGTTDRDEKADKAEKDAIKTEAAANAGKQAHRKETMP